MDFDQLFNKLKTCYEDKTPKNYNGNFIIQFEILDLKNKAITIVIYPGIVEVNPYRFINKNLLVKCSALEAEYIANGKIKFSELESRRIEFEGDVTQANKLFKSFTSRKKILGTV